MSKTDPMTPEKRRHDVEGQADFSVVSWKSKGDDLWLYHKASGNKKANLYELALVGEIESLRAELASQARTIAALETQLAEARTTLPPLTKEIVALAAMSLLHIDHPGMTLELNWDNRPEYHEEYERKARIVLGYALRNRRG